MNEVRIVVATAGFVFVGEVDTLDDKAVILKNANNIRVYGTAGIGLGALALRGKQPDTVLDAIGDVHVPMTSVVAMYIVRPEVSETLLMP